MLLVPEHVMLCEDWPGQNVAAKEQFKTYDPVGIRSSSSVAADKEVMLSGSQGVHRITESWNITVVQVGRDLKLF